MLEEIIIKIYKIMKRTNAKELLPIIKAYAEDKTIQFFSTNKGWTDKEYLNFSEEPYLYRVKPDPKYRPFKSVEECWNEMQKHQPFGWVKYKEKEEYCNIMNIYQQLEDLIAIIDSNGYTFSELFNKFIFTDNSLFGIKEE